MVEMEITECSDLGHESSNEIEAPDISDSDSTAPDISHSDSTDVALRLRNMGLCQLKVKAYGNNVDENGAMGNGGELVRTPHK